MVSVQARRDAVAFATTRGVSQRRACTLLDVARSALGYCSRLAVKDAPALKRMIEEFPCDLEASQRLIQSQ